MQQSRPLASPVVIVVPIIGGDAGGQTEGCAGVGVLLRGGDAGEGVVTATTHCCGCGGAEAAYARDGGGGEHCV